MFNQKKSQIKHVRFLVWGYYGVRNFGDEVMMSVIIKNLKERFHNCEITVRQDSEGNDIYKDGIRFVHYRDGYLYLIRRFIYLIRLVGSQDVLLVGGGTIFGERGRWKVKGLIYWAIFIFIAKLLGRKVVVFSVGIARVSSVVGKWILRLITSLADKMLIRDEPSYRQLRSFGCSYEKVVLTGDVVSLYLTEHEVDSKREEGGQFQVGVSLMPYYSTYIRDAAGEDRLVCFLASYFDWLQKRINCKFIFFVMQDSPIARDGIFTKKVIALMQDQEQHQLLDYSEDFSLVVRNIQKMDLFIGMRLHALLFSLLGGVPSLGLSVNVKINNLMKMLHCDQYCVDVSELSLESLILLTEKLLKEDKAMFKRHTALSEFQNAAIRNFDLLEQVVGLIV